MNEYTICRKPAPAGPGEWTDAYWADVPVVAIANYHPDSSDHHPRAEVKLTHSSDAIHVFFRVEDQYVRSVATKRNDPVCCDSCVEFFLAPRPDAGSTYFNFEFAAGGVLLASYVEDPSREPGGPLAKYTLFSEAQASGITAATSLPGITDPEIAEPTTWTLQYTLPLAAMESFVGPLAPLDGRTMRANFYKCGDDTSHPHWGAWNSIGDELNFHQPAQFGPLRFE
ncbi:MAG: carbohydrate-binding family 9-like protein [Phycisphaerales bacterium]|jgi:hypothetical protein|nr:carbohydrate-binding family 9-like protein [Phycisphaerales bacterium]MBT7171778.1 carbohydrate-binding family 9-like protein [Phycisphaerales bacterium]